MIKLMEIIKIPVKVGDTILTGKFKNKKTVVKTIGTDEHGMPTINGRKVVTFRFPKEVQKEEKLNRVVKNTDNKRKSRSTKIGSNLSTVIKFKTQAGHRMHFRLKTESQSVPGRKYTVDFRTPLNYGLNEDNWKKLPNGSVAILGNCTCPDFKYRWETILHKKNSARRVISNGEMPNIQNPEHKLAFCKHILSGWSVVKEYIKKTNFNKIKARKRK